MPDHTQPESDARPIVETIEKLINVAKMAEAEATIMVARLSEPFRSSMETLAFKAREAIDESHGCADPVAAAEGDLLGELVAALEAVSLCESQYSRDPLERAVFAVEHCREVANAALAKAKR